MKQVFCLKPVNYRLFLQPAVQLVTGYYKLILGVAYCNALPWHGLSVCMSSVTLVYPAKAVRRNEMPFDRDTRVVATNIVLDMGPPYSRGKGRFRGWNPQLAAMPRSVKLLWPLSPPCIGKQKWKDGIANPKSSYYP